MHCGARLGCVEVSQCDWVAFGASKENSFDNVVCICSLNIDFEDLYPIPRSKPIHSVKYFLLQVLENLLMAHARK